MTFDPTGKDSQLIKDSKIIDRFIHAGKGELTLASPRTWHAHSYRFEFPANRAMFPEGTIFVYVLHNEHKMYIGMLDDELGVRCTNRSVFVETTEAVKGARYIVKMARSQELVDRQDMLIYHSGRCCRCGTKLRSENAMLQGMGRSCLKMYNQQINKEKWDGN